MSYSCEIDLLSSLDWQRSNADKLIDLITLKQKWYQENHCDFWNNWVTDVFNLDTANEFGLSVWSRILDLPLFGENILDDLPVDLTLEQKRIMLKLKAFSCNMSSSTSEINRRLSVIFDSTDLIAFDGLKMNYYYYVFSEEMLNFVETLVKYELLPAPNSVLIVVIIEAVPDPFGFVGAPNANGFGVGTLASLLFLP